MTTDQTTRIARTGIQVAIPALLVLIAGLVDLIPDGVAWAPVAVSLGAVLTSWLHQRVRPATPTPPVG